MYLERNNADATVNLRTSASFSTTAGIRNGRTTEDMGMCLGRRRRAAALSITPRRSASTWIAAAVPLSESGSVLNATLTRGMYAHSWGTALADPMPPTPRAFASSICASCRSCLTSQYSSARSRLFSCVYNIWSASSCRPKRPSKSACSRRNDDGKDDRSLSDRMLESGQLSSRRNLNLYMAPRLESSSPSSSPRSDIMPSRSR